MHAVLQAEERHGIGGRSCNGGRSSSSSRSSGGNGSAGAGGGCGGGGIAKGCDTIGGTGAGTGAAGAGADTDADAANDLVDVGGTPAGERDNGISLCIGETKNSCLKEACSAPGKPEAAEPGTVGGRGAKGVGAGDAPASAVAAAAAAAVAAMAARAAKVAAAAAAAGKGAAVLDDGTWLDMWTSLVNVLEVGCAASGEDWDWSGGFYYCIMLMGWSWVVGGAGEVGVVWGGMVRGSPRLF